ncbi:MAG: outer membrane lipid asymmetry maintenance protein MlaD, partial [Rhodospirillaceae bacterium]|nr:outer membrane lipid asymmetry maintenance protein MlaD [Rhodospirillaceae bacterium]
MSRNVIETVMGAVVLLVAAVFLIFVYSSTNVRASSGYPLTARFNRVDGVSTGTEIRLSGIKVGTVTGIDLDPKTYLAVLHMSIRRGIELPVDSTVKIQSDGLLGGTYVDLEPGGADKMLKPGDEIRLTQDPINIADLIGRFIFSAAEVKKDEGAGQDGGGAPAAPAPVYYKQKRAHD